MGALKSDRCSKNHQMIEGNLYHRPDGKRECLTCKKERNRGRSGNSETSSKGEVGGVVRRSGFHDSESGKQKEGRLEPCRLGVPDAEALNEYGENSTKSTGTNYMVTSDVVDLKHDPKTCRIYRCFTCVGMGKKF
jgi:hypothetical protein